MKGRSGLRQLWTCAAAIAGAALISFASAPALAQADAYPSHPITLLVPFSARGS
jgi:tripartite-type tricarboxylate transporter receptor subunit TctC